MNRRRLDRQSTGDDELSRSHTPRRGKRTRTDADGSDDAATHTKVRMRVTRACNQCRKRKDRCDGGRPSCGSCINLGRTCNYNPPKKRGLRTGYVRAIEVLLGMMLSTIEDSDSWMAALMKGKGQKPSFRLRDWRSGIAPDADVAEFLVDAWRKSEVLRQTEQWLSTVESAEGDEDGDSSKAFDSGINKAMELTASILDEQVPQINATADALSPNNTTAISPIQIDKQPRVVGTSPSFIQQETASIFADHISPTTTQVYCPNDDMGIQFDQTLPSRPENSGLPENWTFLLDIYFANTHSWLPVVQKHELLRLAYMVANDNRNSDVPEGMSKGDLAFLWAILAYSSNQVEDQRIRNSVEPFRIRAADLLAETLEECNLGHVRTYIVLAILQLDRGNRSTAWLAIGQATYVATTVLLSDTSKNNNTQIDEGTKRTLLCCFVLDTLIASWVNSRPYFQRTDLKRIGVLPTDSMEEWEPWQSKDDEGRVFIPKHTPGHILSTFNHLVQLVACLNDLIRFQNEDKGIERFQELGRCLRTWGQNNIPRSQNCDDVEMTPQKLNLQLAFATVLETFITEEWRQSMVRQELVSSSNCANMEEQGKLLGQRLQIMGARYIPPTCSIYLFCFDKSLDYRIRLQANPRIAEDLQMLRISLSNFNKKQLQARNFLDNSQSRGPKTTGSIITNRSFDMDLQPDIWSSTRDVRMNSTTPAGTRPSTRPEEVNVASILHHSDYLRQLNTHPAVASEHLLNPHATLDRLSSTSLGQAFGFGQEMDTAAGEIDDDELFQSLANLDSADW